MTVYNNYSHFLIFILWNVRCFFFFFLIFKTYFDSFLFVPPGGSRASQMQEPFSHQAIKILIASLPSASFPDL